MAPRRNSPDKTRQPQTNSVSTIYFLHALLYNVSIMFWIMVKRTFRAINILSAVLIAGMYVYGYYDYLHTITTNNVTVGAPTYSNQGVGTITINEQVDYQ